MFPESMENMQTVDLIYPNLSVQSFITLSQQCYYILDSQGLVIANFCINSSHECIVIIEKFSRMHNNNRDNVI